MSRRKPLDPPELAGYDFIAKVGAGGFADVFLYERKFPRQRVAIKVLAMEALGDSARERFTAEANVMASLSTHPYIVAIYQADVSPDGHPYIVMQYYPRDNYQIRARNERFSVAGVLRSGIQVASAVETAHRNGVLHRDIKPANILTSDYWLPGLTDFGIAGAVGNEVEVAEGMSVPWSPPEVVAGSGLTDERADVYSLGATLYTLLCGRSPFEVVGGSNRTIDLIDRIRRSKPGPIERPDVPDSLWRLLLHAMNRDPDGRPSSAAEFARALQVIEVEQRFDMTPFEVSDGDDAPVPAQPVDVDAGSTRVKGVGRIESQAPAPMPVAGQTTTAHDAFRPDDTVMRTASKPPRGAKRSAKSASDMISDTPWVPTADPKPPVRIASKDGPKQTAAIYASSKPIDPAADAARRRVRRVVAIASVAVVLVAVATGLVVSSMGKDDTPTTTAPVAAVELTGLKYVGPSADYERTDDADPGKNDYLLTWEQPKNGAKGDVYQLMVNNKPAKDNGTYPEDVALYFESSRENPCVVLRMLRDGKPVAEASYPENCA